MRITIILSALLAPIGVLAAPAPIEGRSCQIADRQAPPTKPKPCVRVPNTTVEETEARFNKFAQAFIYKKNITEAFEYIVEDYINHNPMAQNGFDSAWNILSPIWGSQNITPLRTLFRSPQGWLNYRGGFGDIIDRFRWEGGCIAEHWDSGERWPTT